MKNKNLLLISLVFFISILFIGLILFCKLTERMDTLKTELYDQIRELRETNIELTKENIKLKFGTQHQLEEDYKIQITEITGYAPLDPKAKEGICYQGDPKITASGYETTPGITVAADSSIPFGTWIWIEDLGWRRVEDRGGKIKGNKIDVCFISQQEALEWGRKTKFVIIPGSIMKEEMEN